MRIVYLKYKQNQAINEISSLIGAVSIAIHHFADAISVHFRQKLSTKVEYNVDNHVQCSLNYFYRNAKFVLV